MTKWCPILEQFFEGDECLIFIDEKCDLKYGCYKELVNIEVE